MQHKPFLLVRGSLTSRSSPDFSLLENKMSHHRIWRLQNGGITKTQSAESSKVGYVVSELQHWLCGRSWSLAERPGRQTFTSLGVSSLFFRKCSVNSQVNRLILVWNELASSLPSLSYTLPDGEFLHSSHISVSVFEVNRLGCSRKGVFSWCGSRNSMHCLGFSKCASEQFYCSMTPFMSPGAGFFILSELRFEGITEYPQCLCAEGFAAPTALAPQLRNSL